MSRSRQSLILPLLPLFALSMFSACDKDEPQSEGPPPAEVMAELERVNQEWQRDAAALDRDMMDGQDELLTALGQVRASGHKMVPPISTERLARALPNPPGWTRTESGGELVTIPYTYTTATAVYAGQGREISAEIIDSGNNPVMTLPFALLTRTTYEKRTEEGYERSTRLAGQPGWEKWDSDTRAAKVGMIVHGRYMVTFEAKGMDSPGALRRFAEAIDVTALPQDDGGSGADGAKTAADGAERRLPPQFSLD